MSGEPPSSTTYFKKRIHEYAAATYWRADEDALVQKYFTDNTAKLLVLGCGGGRVLPHLARFGFRITAIDIELAMVDAAKKNYPDLGIEFSVQDAAKLEFKDRTFKYVFFPFHGIDYVEPDIYAAVQEAARVLVDDGILIFNSHNRLYIKKWQRLFRGAFDTYEGLRTYRTSPLDIPKLRRYFDNVKAIQRISLIPREQANWKDRVYQLVPWLNKSTYFVCENPVRP